MSAKHTPGPWRTVPFIYHGSRIGIQDADGKWVGEEGYAEIQHIPRFSPAHARRIVACVNAFDGVTTEAIEELGPMAGVMADPAQDRINELEAQREELLKALKFFLKWGRCQKAEDMARAAIAKAIG